LQHVTANHIENWLLEYISPDQEVAASLFKVRFSDLAVQSSMSLVEKELSSFIDEYNNKNPAIINLIH
jgi:hypothetical protein